MAKHFVLTIGLFFSSQNAKKTCLTLAYLVNHVISKLTFLQKEAFCICHQAHLFVFL